MSPAAGESESFEGFYRRRWQEASRWASALCGNRVLGEELAQEAFIAIQPRFSMLNNPEGYLRRTIVNLTKEAHRSTARRRWRERTTPGEATSRAAADSGLGDPELIAALSCLSHEQRAVLVLRYWADWDETSIAESLGCRRSTVRSHAKRGLDQLRAELETDR